jgi:hypothetical protein
MNRDEIIKLAREACDRDTVDAWHNNFWTLTQEELERFAALVAAAEREACAHLLESFAWSDDARFFASAIRKRGEE